MTAQQVIDDALKTLRANLANQIDAMTLAHVRKPVRYIGAEGPALTIEDITETLTPVTLIAHEHLTRLRMEAARLTRIPGPVEVYRINHRDERVAVLEARIQFIERKLNGFDNSAAEYALRRATAKGSRRPRSRPAP